jgi:acyl-CoA synthetase (AMP-forming)/AMP-acid ligase II
MVDRYTDRLALRAKGHELAYEALNQEANRVARAILAERGEGEEPVALLLENDSPMIIAILGALKTRKI